MRRESGTVVACQRASWTLAAICVACLWMSGCSGTKAQDGQGKSNDNSDLPELEVSPPLRMAIVEWDEYVGRLRAVETVEVRARVSGYLSRLCFDEGQTVEANDLLAVIDQRPFEAEVLRNEALHTAAQSQLKQAESAAAQARAEKQRVEIRRNLAHKLLTRSQQLRQSNATTAEDFEVREAELAAAESEVLVADARIESADAAVKAADSAVGVAAANLALARLNLTYTEIHAPISGRVSSHYVTKGNFVSGGSDDATLLTTIVSVDPIHCYFDADEQSHLKYVRLAKSGARPSSRDVRNPVRLALADDRNSFPHRGHMDFVDNRLDFETGTMRARAILSNPDGDLAPGLFTRVRIPGSQRYEAILVPDRVIGTDQAEKFVLVVNDQNVVERRIVVLGPISHGLRVIRNGLTGDERVVLSGQHRAQVGNEVTTTIGRIEATEEVLPDEYQPVPESEWLTPPRTSAANAEARRVHAAKPAQVVVEPPPPAAETVPVAVPDAVQTSGPATTPIPPATPVIPPASGEER